MIARLQPDEEPLNREPGVAELIKSFITPSSITYDRNHGPIPEISASDHLVHIKGVSSEPFTLTIAEMRSMPQNTVICALQCAGNRRHTMRTLIKEVDGLDWFDSAVMNCEWRGPSLSYILSKAGMNPDDTDGKHVAFATHAQTTQDDEFYGASISLARAMDPSSDVILALEMNGAPLMPKHGAPVRAIVPGVAGARSVKWLEEISVQDRESDCFYQQRDYKVLPPEATDREAAKNFWDQTPSLQDMPINSAIGFPESGTKVKPDADGYVRVAGYALPNGRGDVIELVQVSGDNGRTWIDAELRHDEGRSSSKWSWSLWTAKIKMEKGAGQTIVSRAQDCHGVQQEETAQWNLRGVAYNGYGRVDELDIL